MNNDDVNGLLVLFIVAEWIAVVLFVLLMFM